MSFEIGDPDAARRRLELIASACAGRASSSTEPPSCICRGTGACYYYFHCSTQYFIDGMLPKCFFAAEL